MKSKNIVLLVAIVGLAVALCSACKPEYPKCENDEHCAEKGEFCVNGMCQQCRTNAHCGPCQQCQAGKCVQIEGCCQTDMDCAQGQKCRNGRCGPQCLSDAECGPKEACQGGACVPVACVQDADCPAGQRCENYQCVQAQAECTLETVYFDFDEAGLTSEARRVLEANAECIKAKNPSTVILQGHADERGTEEYNLALGERRARSVKEYLQRLGVGANLRTVSYGENRPVVRGSGEAVWSQNRRVEFVIQ